MLVVIFSKDRPLQLDATLRSFIRHCRDFQTASVKVIVKASSDGYANGYNILQKDYQHHSNIELVPEGDFRRQVLELIRQDDYLLWLVDDNIFVRDFSLDDLREQLAHNPDALCYSLRLGKNTTYCYPLDKQQALPDFRQISSSTLKYNWTTAEYDFGYPLEVSSSLYRTRDLLPLLESIKFFNPNSLEGEMATHSSCFKDSHPFLLCPPISLTFCNPINKVQSTASENRAGESYIFTPESLLASYMQENRVDVAAFDGFVPNACHQEVPLRLFKCKTSPLISVVIPCYNQAHFLSEAVESVVAQTFTAWECLIVNDGSPDNTSQVAKELIERYPDRQIKLLEKENGGLADARNFGIRWAQGEYILPLDADDIIHPEMLAKTFKMLNSQPDIAIVYTDLIHFGAVEKYVVAGEYDFQSLRYANQLNYCSLYRRKVWKQVGGYNTNMTWGYEDWDFWVGAGEQGFVAQHLPEALLFYRVKSESMYTKALEHDAELKAKIVLNHPNLYNEQERAWAREVLEAVNVTLPLVSVIVPTFNRPDMLAKALDSVLAQSYQNFEIVVVNDCGPDVEQIINSRKTQAVITYIRNETNLDRSATRNIGIKAAQGKYIAYLDDDDLYYPDHLQTLVDFLENSEYAVAYTDAHRLNQHKEGDHYVTESTECPYSEGFDADRMLADNYIPILCVMHRTSCLEQSGLFDETLNRHEDWDLWIRMSRIYPFAHIKRITCAFTSRIDVSDVPNSSRPAFLRTYDRICQKYPVDVSTQPSIAKSRCMSRYFLVQDMYHFLLRKLSTLVGLLPPPVPTPQLCEQLMATGTTHAEAVSAYYLYCALQKGTAHDQSVVLLQQAIKEDPDNIIARLNIHQVLVANGRHEDAIKHLELLHASNPYEVMFLSPLVDYYLNRNKGKAYYYLKCLLKEQPDNAELRTRLDMLYRDLALPAIISKKKCIAIFSLDRQESACPQLRLLGPLGRLIDEYDIRWGAQVADNKCTTDLDAIQAADIIVVQRFYPRQGTLPFLEQMLATGKPVIYELDDLITDVPDDNHLKPWIKETANLLPILLPRFSAITVSTAVLADVCRAYNPHVYVLPNLIDERLWHVSAKPISSGPVVIGFAGTATHRADLQAIEPALFKVAAKYGDRVAFRFMGDYSPGCKELPGFSYVPFAESYREYADQLPSAGFDIALIPLQDNSFNRAKSNIKWLEYSACGIAGVYADLTPYNSCIRHGETGLLAGGDPEQWFQAICLLIEQPEYRRKIASNARREVLTHHSLCSGAQRWAQVYGEVLIRHGARGMAQHGHLEKSSVVVSIIIPVFNQLHFTQQCLQALFNTLPSDITYEIIVVNNASSDGTSEYLGGLADQVQVITNSTNLGFAKACNQGARAARGEYLLFLNNDTVPLAGWLEAMLSGAKQDCADIVGAKLLYPDGAVQHAGVVFSDEGLGMHVFKELASNSPPVNRKRVMQCVTAAAMLVKRSVFKQLDGFDELFLNGFEDVDFCLRAGQLGKKILYLPESVLIHHESRTEGRSKNEDANLAIFKSRWSGKVVSDEISVYEAEGLFGPIGSDGVERYQKILGYNETALRLYLKILGKYPEDVGALLNISTILMKQGRDDDAQLFANKAQRLMGKEAGQRLAISIVIPVLNQLHFTQQCLQALFSTLPSDITFEIIVVDNASSDGTDAYLRSLGDRLRVISNATNLGFAKACNQGARAARGEYLLLLNNDTVVQPGWLEPLLKAIQSGEADICGARLLYPDGRCQHAGIAFDERGLGYHIFGGFPGDAPEVTQRREMQAVTGACLMISKQLFAELEGFDEEFRNGFEDVDLCLRAGEYGKKILYLPESVVIHYAEQTPGRKDHDIPNMQRFFKRWSGKLRQDDQQLYRQFGLTCSKDQEGRFRITRDAGSVLQVSIIIPLFNQVGLTQACLAALQRATKAGSYELVLVDNGSADGTAELLERWRHEATVIRNLENGGFAKACNQGARAARGEYLLFLNNDTVVQHGWLEPLLEVLEQDASVAAVGSKLLYPDGTIQHAGVLLVDDQQQGDPLVARHLYQRMPGDHPAANMLRSMQALTAACLLVRRTDFETVGGFDEGYWNGYEDVDLCLKLAAAGKRLVYQPASVVVHHESQSGPERFRQAGPNIQRLHQRWLGKVQVDAIIQADGTIQHGPGMLSGTTAIYQPPAAPATVQAKQPTASARPRQYQLVPLVAGSASSLLQRLSSSRTTRDVLQRYTTDV